MYCPSRSILAKEAARLDAGEEHPRARVAHPSHNFTLGSSPSGSRKSGYLSSVAPIEAPP